MSDFAGEVRRLMRERCMSLRALGKAAGYDASYLSKVLNGKKPCSPYMAKCLDDALGAERRIVEAAASAFDGSLAEDRRDRLDWAARKPRSTDLATVDALSEVLASQRRMEDCLGSEAMLRPVQAQMAIIETLVGEARGQVRPRLVHVAGQWAQFLGWLYANTGDHGKGGAWLRRALGWAVESGDINLISEVLSFQGHAAWIAGQPGSLIGLSQAARRDASAYPGQLAISAAQEAQGRAMTGDARDVDRLLDQADELAARARERPGDAPPWLYYHSAGFFALQRGLAFRYLAADPRYRHRAVEALTAGHAQLPPGDQASEWGAEFLVYLADVHARGGDLEQACANAMAAAAVARQMESARLLRMLRRLRAGLASRWPDDARVGELAEALRLHHVCQRVRCPARSSDLGGASFYVRVELDQAAGHRAGGAAVTGMTGAPFDGRAAAGKNRPCVQPLTSVVARIDPSGHPDGSQAGFPATRGCGLEGNTQRLVGMSATSAAITNSDRKPPGS